MSTTSEYLREVGDALRLGDALRRAGRVAVIGAGWIGSEVAASARQMGAEVGLIDPAPVPLQRVLGEEIGEVFRHLHADNGVQLRLRTGVVELRGTDTVEQVVLSGGEIEAADVVVIGIGVTPRVELAQAVGLKVDNGIVVDEHLQSSAPGVYAAGDVASAWHPHYRQQLRVEHWSNALNQGVTAGANAAGGTETCAWLPYSSPTSTTSAWNTSTPANPVTRSWSAGGRAGVHRLLAARRHRHRRHERASTSGTSSRTSRRSWSAAPFSTSDASRTPRRPNRAGDPMTNLQRPNTDHDHSPRLDNITRRCPPARLAGWPKTCTCPSAGRPG